MARRPYRSGSCATIALMATEVVEVEGHIIDSLILAKVLDTIVDAGADYRMVDVEIGRASTDTSRARIEVDAENEALLATLLTELQLHGANKVEDADASLEACGRDGVLPEGFYSTTNLKTQVRLDGHWIDVENPEMDCAIVVRDGSASRRRPCIASAQATRSWSASTEYACSRSSGPGARTPSSSWRPRCRRRNPRNCWSPRSPTASSPAKPRAGRSSPCVDRR